MNMLHTTITSSLVVPNAFVNCEGESNSSELTAEWESLLAIVYYAYICSGISLIALLDTKQAHSYRICVSVGIKYVRV